MRKFGKMTGHTYSEYQFDKFLICSTSNHRKQKWYKLAEIDLENS